MFSKLMILAAVAASALAVPHATSYASVTQQHGDYHHGYGDEYPHGVVAYDGYGYGDGHLGYHGGYNYRGNGGYYGDYNGHYSDDHHDYFHHPQYTFKYGVEDPHTHDIKSQEEHRDGDVVKGHYKLVQPDGRTRLVHYTADKHNGFNAVIQYLGHAEHPSYYKYY